MKYRMYIRIKYFDNYIGSEKSCPYDGKTGTYSFMEKLQGMDIPIYFEVQIAPDPTGSNAYISRQLEWSE